MAHTRLITLNGSGGAFVAVSATQVTRRVEIIEDGSANGGTGQGLAYQFNDGSSTPFTTTYTIEPQIRADCAGHAGAARRRLWVWDGHAGRQLGRLYDCRDAAYQPEIGEHEHDDRTRDGIRLGAMMKQTLLVVLAIVLCFSRTQAQNAGQIIAAQYGEFQVAGSTVRWVLLSACDLPG